MNKKCCGCKNVLEFSEFNRQARSKDGLQQMCKTCNRDKGRKYYEEHKEEHLSKIKFRQRGYVHRNIERLNAIKAHNGCATCLENEVCCIDFHHLRDKKFGLHLVASGFKTKWQVIQEEVLKCACLCANCHRKLHKGLLNVDKVVACTIPDDLCGV